MSQMVGKAKTGIEHCGLFPTALLEFNAFDEANKDWGNITSDFGEAYENLIIMGPGIRVPGTIANIQELEGKDNSLGTITDAMGSMPMVNNVNTQEIRGDVSALRQELAQMRSMMQMQANSAYFSAPTAQYAAPPVPPFVQFVPPPAPPPSYYLPQQWQHMQPYIPPGPSAAPQGPPPGF